MEQFITDLLASITAQTSLGGWAIVIGIFGTLIMFSVRGVKIIKNEWWNTLTPLAKFLLPFGAAAIGTFVIGLAGAIATKVVISTIIGKLIASAIAAGFAAVTIHEGSSNVGTTVDMMLVKKDPNYIPGSIRKKMSLLLDIPNVEKMKEITKEIVIK